MSLHRWDVSVIEATEIQNDLRDRIEFRALSRPPRTIAGADISHNRFSKDLFAAVVVFSYPDLVEVNRAFARGEANFPYVPGYLSFREIPTLLDAFGKLNVRPDVIMADGQGIAHPRRMGLAAHLGLTLGIPTFGCAKSVLYGKSELPPTEAGTRSDLLDPRTGEIIGALVRTKDRCKPVIVSPGHCITLNQSVGLTLTTTRGYRIPEPTRHAHRIVNEYRVAS